MMINETINETINEMINEMMINERDQFFEQLKHHFYSEIMETTFRTRIK